MQHLKKVLRITPAVMLLAFLISVPVFAEDSGSGSAAISSNDTSVSTSTATPRSGKPKVVAAVSPSGEQSTVDSTTETETHKSMRTEAETEVSDLKKQHAEHKAADRQNFCNMHKDNLTGKFKGLTTSATAIQTHIDSVYVKVQAFVADKSLTVDTYDTLVANANTAKAKAAADIAALTPPTLDCTSATVATDVATFKVTATQTRTDLKAYRDAVKELFKAVKAAAAKAAPTASSDSTTTTTPNTEGAN